MAKHKHSCLTSKEMGEETSCPKHKGVLYVPPTLRLMGTLWFCWLLTLVTTSLCFGLCNISAWDLVTVQVCSDEL